MLSDHSRVKLEINDRQMEKPQYLWVLLSNFLITPIASATAIFFFEDYISYRYLPLFPMLIMMLLDFQSHV